MTRTKTVEDAEVLSAAREVFRRDGHAASTRDVARAAKISQAVLYQRFGSKDEMFFRAMTPDPLDVDAMLGPYPPEDGLGDLVAIGEKLLSYLQGFMPTLLKVLAVPGVDGERLRSWHSQLPFLRLTDAIAARFRRMSEDGLIGRTDPHASAVAFIAAIHSLALFERLTSSHERTHHKANARELVMVLWQGLAPR